MTPTKHVSSLQAKKDDFRHTKVTVFASGNSIDFTFTHNDAQRFKDKLQELLSNQDQSGSPGATQALPASSPGAIEQLKKLAELRDSGVVTPKEFDAKKVELLARL